VKVGSDAAATTAAVNAMDSAMALSDDLYELPAQITVPDGQRETTFNLKVDMNKLEAAFSTNFDTRNIVLVVGLSDNSKYDLNPTLAKTTVIIDRNFFAPVLKVTGVKLNQSSMILDIGSTATLIDSITPPKANNQNVIWTSNNPSAVSVSNQGVVTALSAGFATITVTTVDGGYKASCIVWVPGAGQVYDNLLINGDFETPANSTLLQDWTTISLDWVNAFYNGQFPEAGPVNNWPTAGANLQNPADRFGRYNNFGANVNALPFADYISGDYYCRLSGLGGTGGVYQLVTVTPGKTYGFSIIIYYRASAAAQTLKNYETVKILSPDGLTPYHLEPVPIDPNKLFPAGSTMNTRPVNYVTTVRGLVTIPNGVTQIRFQFDQRTIAVTTSPFCGIDNCQFFELK